MSLCVNEWLFVRANFGACNTMLGRRGLEVIIECTDLVGVS